MSFFQPLLACFFSIFFFSFPSCQSDGQSPTTEMASNQLPTKRELRKALGTQKNITFVFPSLETHQNYIQKELDILNQNERFGFNAKAIQVNDLNAEHLKNEILFFIGKVTDSLLLKTFQHSLPVQFTRNAFIFNHKTYDAPSAVFKLSPYPNPYNKKLPLYLLTGNDDKIIFDFLKQRYQAAWVRLLWSNWGYEIFQNNELKVSGNLNESNWTLNKKTHFDFTEQNDTIYKTDHFQFIAHRSPLTKAEIEIIAQKCEESYALVTNFIGKKKAMSLINYHFYPTVESKGLQRNSMKEASVNHEEHRIEVVMNEHFQGSLLQHENKLLIRQLLGTPQLLALEEGFSNHFTKQWQKKGYQYWANKLFQSNNLPPLKELLDNAVFEKESYLVMGAMAGLFVDFLIDKFGKATFLNQYQKWDVSTLMALDAEWQQYLSAQNKSNNLVTNHAAKKTLPYLKGFNFAHEGYRVYNGYGSQLAKESLNKLSNIGANAISIIPYSYMRNPKQPSYIPLFQSAGGENDQAVLFSHYEAQKMGMFTMLKPQLWLGDSWPGDVEMKNEADWDRFFDNYYRWVRHFALLAEINGFDSYCLGVEFAKATIAKPEEWRKIIQKIRGIYSGPLTYAANWGTEFENLNFWNELDFIGLNCYYPLSKNARPSKRELSKAFKGIIQKVEKVAQKYNKPLVFTEIGFRSVERTWENPHAHAGNRQFNDANQKLCYEIVFEGIKNKAWCKGLFWWKWPSYLEHRKGQNTGFSPNSKQTEVIISKYFKTKNVLNK
jgi:hypothetical protein